VLAVIAFSMDRRSADGIAKHCRECTRESHTVALRKRRALLHRGGTDFFNPAGKYGIN